MNQNSGQNKILYKPVREFCSVFSSYNDEERHQPNGFSVLHVCVIFTVNRVTDVPIVYEVALNEEKSSFEPCAKSTRVQLSFFLSFNCRKTTTHQYCTWCLQRKIYEFYFLPARKAIQLMLFLIDNTIILLLCPSTIKKKHQFLKYHLKKYRIWEEYSTIPI